MVILTLTGIPIIFPHVEFGLKGNTRLTHLAVQGNGVSVLIFRKHFMVGRVQAWNHARTGGVIVGLHKWLLGMTTHPVQAEVGVIERLYDMV